VIRKLLYIVAGLACIAAGVALVRDTYYQGQDFEVFWRVSREVMLGKAVYDPVRDGAMVFKYPPWILPAFLPFTAMSLGAAKWTWGGIELLSLGVVVVWSLRKIKSYFLLLPAIAAFWGIWAVHALDGQVTLVLLALVLIASSIERAGLRLGLAAWALSTKIFGMISMPGVFHDRREFKKLLIPGLVLLWLSVPALLVTPHHSPVRLVKTWAQAAASGGTAFGAEKVRGRENQGLPAAALRLAKVPAEKTGADLLAFALIALALGSVWILVSRPLEREEKLVGWLALGAIAHPLAWFHQFVLVFPLAIVSLDRAWRSRRWLSLTMSILGIALIGLVTRRTMGNLGACLESLSVKSWGTILCAAALVLAARSLSKRGRVRA
jgi:hypothetical protein